MDTLTLRDDLIAYLAPLGADITDGDPATDRDGRVRRTVILDLTPGTADGRRMSGRGTHRRRAVTAMVVTPSRDSCIWLVERVLDVLDGTRVTGGGLITDVSYDGPPTQEPGTSPARWSKPLTLNVTTTRGAP